MEEILDRLIEQIKLDQRYQDYLEAEKKLDKKENKQLLQEYHQKIEEYNDLKKYESYIDLNQIKDEIKQLKKQISLNKDIVDYYQKYHCLNDFLEEITKIVFGNISTELDLSRYEL